MCSVELAATFMTLYLARVVGVFSNPNIARVHRRGIHYSISATLVPTATFPIQGYSFDLLGGISPPGT